MSEWRYLKLNGPGHLTSFYRTKSKKKSGHLKEVQNLVTIWGFGDNENLPAAFKEFSKEYYEPQLWAKRNNELTPVVAMVG